MLRNRAWSLRSAGPSASGAEAARFEALRGSCAGEPLAERGPPDRVHKACDIRRLTLGARLPAPAAAAGPSCVISTTARIRSRRFGGGEARWCTVPARGNQEPVLEFVVSKC